MERPSPLQAFLRALRADLFTALSWAATLLIVAALLGFGYWWTHRSRTDAPAAPAQTPNSTALGGVPALPAVPAAGGGPSASIGRALDLKTALSQEQSFAVTQYQVVAGDSLFAIAKQFNIKPETILYSNKGSLNDNPENLKPGMELTIPPVDGVLYLWQKGDTVQKIADQFKAKADDILNWPGNAIDLTDPEIKPGTLVMVPGGQRALIDWTSFIPTYSRGTSGAGTGTSNIGTHQCGGGPIGPVSVWPVMNEPHTVSGNDYVVPTHLGIDITGRTGDPVVAAGSGVVVIAAPMGQINADNYGYGNFIEIDHGNGYATIYAHLSAIDVTVCQGVVAGQIIGAVGATGNASGPHLHFEVRFGSGNKNPHEFVQ